MTKKKDSSNSSVKSNSRISKPISGGDAKLVKQDNSSSRNLRSNSRRTGPIHINRDCLNGISSTPYRVSRRTRFFDEKHKFTGAAKGTDAIPKAARNSRAPLSSAKSWTSVSVVTESSRILRSHTKSTTRSSVKRAMVRIRIRSGEQHQPLNVESAPFLLSPTYGAKIDTRAVTKVTTDDAKTSTSSCKPRVHMSSSRGRTTTSIIPKYPWNLRSRSSILVGDEAKPRCKRRNVGERDDTTIEKRLADVREEKVRGRSPRQASRERQTLQKQVNKAFEVNEPKQGPGKVNFKLSKKQNYQRDPKLSNPVSKNDQNKILSASQDTSLSGAEHETAESEPIIARLDEKCQTLKALAKELNFEAKAIDISQKASLTGAEPETEAWLENKLAFSLQSALDMELPLTQNARLEKIPKDIIGGNLNINENVVFTNVKNVEETTNPFSKTHPKKCLPVKNAENLQTPIEPPITSADNPVTTDEKPASPEVEMSQAPGQKYKKKSFHDHVPEVEVTSAFDDSRVVKIQLDKERPSTDAADISHGDKLIVKEHINLATTTSVRCNQAAFTYSVNKAAKIPVSMDKASLSVSNANKSCKSPGFVSSDKTKAPLLGQCYLIPGRPSTRKRRADLMPAHNDNLTKKWRSTGYEQIKLIPSILCTPQPMEIGRNTPGPSTQNMELDSNKVLPFAFRYPPISNGQRELDEHMDLCVSGSSQALPVLFGTNQKPLKQTFGCQPFDFLTSVHQKGQPCFGYNWQSSLRNNGLQNIPKVDGCNQTENQILAFNNVGNAFGNVLPMRVGIFNKASNPSQRMTLGNAASTSSGICDGFNQTTSKALGNLLHPNYQTFSRISDDQMDASHTFGDVLKHPPLRTGFLKQSGNHVFSEIHQQGNELTSLFGSRQKPPSLLASASNESNNDREAMCINQPSATPSLRFNQKNLLHSFGNTQKSTFLPSQALNKTINQQSTFGDALMQTTQQSPTPGVSFTQTRPSGVRFTQTNIPQALVITPALIIGRLGKVENQKAVEALNVLTTTQSESVSLPQITVASSVIGIPAPPPPLLRPASFVYNKKPSHMLHEIATNVFTVLSTPRKTCNPRRVSTCWDNSTGFCCGTSTPRDNLKASPSEANLNQSVAENQLDTRRLHRIYSSSLSLDVSYSSLEPYDYDSDIEGFDELIPSLSDSLSERSLEHNTKPKTMGNLTAKFITLRITDNEPDTNEEAS